MSCWNSEDTYIHCLKYRNFQAAKVFEKVQFLVIRKLCVSTKFPQQEIRRRLRYLKFTVFCAVILKLFCNCWFPAADDSKWKKNDTCGKFYEGGVSRWYWHCYFWNFHTTELSGRIQISISVNKLFILFNSKIAIVLLTTIEKFQTNFCKFYTLCKLFTAWKF